MAQIVLRNRSVLDESTRLEGANGQMTIRITRHTEGKTTTIRLEGRLDANTVPDLEKECRSANPPLQLDLSGMLSADKDGILTLRQLSAEGAELFGASPYVCQLLDTSSEKR